MYFKKTLLSLVLLFSISTFQAQKFELGKVSIAELQEKVHPKDTAAVAAVIFEIGKSRLDETDLTMILEVKTKIKIYKKEGFDNANQQVSFYKDFEKVSFSDVATYNLIDGKIVKTKIGNEGEFIENINKYVSRKKITFPNVKTGSIIEFSYVLRSSNFSIKDWYFQRSIPVNYSEFSLNLPDYLTCSKQSKGYLFPKMKTERGYNQDTKTTYQLENVPAIKEEDFINNVNNYRSGILHELSMINIPGRIYKEFSTDWKSVTKTIYNYDSFGPELEKTGYFEEGLKGVIAGLNTPEEKMDAIVKYVKATVKWNGYFEYYCNDGVKQAYKNKTGNIGEINLMLTAMLRYAGLTANPVLLSTRANGIAVFPSTNAFNYVIAAVESPTGLVLLDASDEFSTPNVLPFRDLNWVGRLIRKDGTSDEVDLMPKVASIVALSMNYSVDANGGVSGKLRRQCTGHKAMMFRQEVKDMKEDAYLEKFENDNKKIEISEYTRTNEKDLKLPVVESLSYKGTNFSELIGGKIYIKPMLSFGDERNPFKQETREYPVDYGFPFLEKCMINIQIPEGYKVESMPAATTLSMVDNLGSFKYVINLTGNSIQMSVTSQINAPIISSEYYATLKEYYQKIIEKQNEKIILVKI